MRKSESEENTGKAGKTVEGVVKLVGERF